MAIRHGWAEGSETTISPEEVEGNINRFLFFSAPVGRYKRKRQEDVRSKKKDLFPLGCAGRGSQPKEEEREIHFLPPPLAASAPTVVVVLILGKRMVAGKGARGGRERWVWCRRGGWVPKVNSSNDPRNSSFPPPLPSFFPSPSFL